jgi:DNA-binding transcriptional ArsR family regulator
MASWTFLTTHARTLLYIARHPDARLRDIAANIGVTERTVTAIMNDLADGGYVVKHRVGRRNRYEIRQGVPMHDLSSNRPTVGQLLRALGAVEPAAEPSDSPRTRADPKPRSQQHRKD